MVPHLNLDFSQVPSGNWNGSHPETTPPSPEAYLDSFLDSFTNQTDSREASTPEQQQIPSLRNGSSHNVQGRSDENGTSTKCTSDKYQEPIAIVGLAFQFPGGVVTEDDFWDMMVEKKCLSCDFPADRINIDAFYSPDDKKKNTVSLYHALLEKFVSHSA